jgi:hypothetical protein
MRFFARAALMRYGGTLIDITAAAERPPGQ